MNSKVECKITPKFLKLTINLVIKIGIKIFPWDSYDFCKNYIFKCLNRAINIWIDSDRIKQQLCFCLLYKNFVYKCCNIYAKMQKNVENNMFSFSYLKRTNLI